MITILLVMLGGGIGAVLRALITNICQRLFNSKIPIATSIVNITGSLIIGFMMGHALDSHHMFPFFVTGVLGGLTTFSTLSSELVNMLNPQFKPIRFVVYSLLQFILGFIACFYGYRI